MTINLRDIQAPKILWNRDRDRHGETEFSRKLHNGKLQRFYSLSSKNKKNGGGGGWRFFWMGFLENWEIV